jgi:hypothetical protein
MTLAERDSSVLSVLSATGLSGRQAVLETIRVCGLVNLFLPGMDRVALETDVDGLRAAVLALQNPSTRAQQVAALPAAQKAGQLPHYPNKASPKNTGDAPQIYPTATADALASTYQLRVVNSGN